MEPTDHNEHILQSFQRLLNSKFPINFWTLTQNRISSGRDRELITSVSTEHRADTQKWMSIQHPNELQVMVKK